MQKLSIAQATPRCFSASYFSLLLDDYDITIPCTHCYMLPTATLLRCYASIVTLLLFCCCTTRPAAAAAATGYRLLGSSSSEESDSSPILSVVNERCCQVVD